MATETKGEKFKRLAEARTQKALKCLELLANLGNAQYNDGSQEQRDYKHKIASVLLSAVQEVEDAWAKKGKVEKEVFTL